MSAILIGCDPEVFVSKKNVFLSAFNLIPGTKANPHKVKRGAVQVDGMALEFNIDPAKSEDEFCLNVQEVFSQLKKMVPEYEVKAVPVAHFDPAYMKQQPEEALELGCDPDFNAWADGVAFVKPNAQRPMRTASGHVHIGWTNGADIQDASHKADCMAVVKQLDYAIGLGSLFYDGDQERRTMYGKPGCFRAKPYGVEYRTLSNAWLRSEALMRWVYRNTVKGVTDLMNGVQYFDRGPIVQEIILENDKKAARKIMQEIGLEIPNV